MSGFDDSVLAALAMVNAGTHPKCKTETNIEKVQGLEYRLARIIVMLEGELHGNKQTAKALSDIPGLSIAIRELLRCEIKKLEGEGLA